MSTLLTNVVESVLRTANDHALFRAMSQGDTRAGEQLVDRVFSLMYSRIYPASPKCGRYASPKYPANTLSIVVVSQLPELVRKQQLRKEGKPVEFAKREGLADSTRLWIAYRSPMVWVSSELSTAINMTKPPLRIEWSTWKFPYPAMVMMVPAGAISVDRDDINIHADVEFIYFAADETNEMLHLVAGTKDGLFDWSYSRVDFSVLDLTDLEGQHEALLGRRSADASFSGGVSKSEMEVYQDIGRCIRYLFGALLIMADRPDLIGPAALVKKVQKKGEHPKEFWTPQVLGAEYKIRRDTTPAVGTHNSPRFHWVRGFYRDQVHGEGRALRKRVWVEPFKRGGD